jgi:hypothetical protein
MKTAWSMMEMRGGPSMAFLSNSSLICLILVSHFIFLLSLSFFFCYFVFVGVRGVAVGSQDRDLSLSHYASYSFHFQMMVCLTIYVDSLGGSPW